ncbi:MAG TPA: hypothetical protein PK078_13720 [Anaerolineales bacterium]|nr:hypothetical protein [Anaerolineales bacterium]
MNQSLTDIRRVMIAGNGAILDTILQNLLVRRTDMEVITVLFDSEENFVEQVLSLTPDIVVINRDTIIDCPGLFFKLSGLLGLKNLQMVILGAESSMVDVFEKREIRLSNSVGLIELLIN